MAKIFKGILGGFRGKVGTVIGSRWCGIDYMRSLGGKRKKGSGTVAQFGQRAKFSLMTSFNSSLSELFATTFKTLANGQTGANAAMAYNISNGLSGTYPNYDIEYPMLKVAHGKLTNAESPATVAMAGSVVKFTWTDNSGFGSAKNTDKAIVVVYCPALKQAAYISAGALRSAALQNITVSQFSGELVETWISFASEDGKNIAASVYTGQVNVS